MKENKRTSLGQQFRRVALVGTLALMLLGTWSSDALGAAAPTVRPAPTPKATPARNNRPPAPRPDPRQKPPKESDRVHIGNAPSLETSLRSRTSRATNALAGAALPVTNCGTGGLICSFDLWAKPGTISTANVPGLSSPLPIWGFSLTASGPALVPGPTLIIRRGQQLNITLHNQLVAAAGNVSLEIPASRNVTPDLDGIPTGSSRLYTFPGGLTNGLQAGTYLYQSGPTADAPRQVLMGLAGLLIVRPLNYSPLTTSAYGTVSSQFQAEAMLEVNEFDSAFNNDPFGMDPNLYEPNVFLVNGRGFDPAHPTTGQIEVQIASVLLLRYANLGNHDRGFTVLNHRQWILADDSSRNFANPVGSGQFMQHPVNVATKWLAAGQVSDSFVLIDPQTREGTRVPIFESGFHLASADGTDGLGGMLTSLLVHGLNGAAGGPVTDVAMNAATVAGSTNTGFTGTQSLTFSGSATSTGNVLQLEWYLDTLTPPGTGRPFNATQCDVARSITLGTTATFSCTISASRLNTLLLSSPPVNGDHVIWVHGRNLSGGWGVVSGDVFTYNLAGPDTGALSAHIGPTNGYRFNDIANGAGPGGTYLPTSDMVVLGTSTQSLADWLVLKGEYCLDSTACANGAGVPLYLTPPMTTGTGDNVVIAGPNPAGTACSSPDVDYGTPGNGNVPPDEPGGGAVVAWCGFIPTATLAALSEGTHTLYAHAFEAPFDGTTVGTGRWGNYSIDGASVQFAVDKTGPAASGMVIDPNPNNGSSSQSGNLNFLDSLQFTATLTDPASPNASNVATAEVFVTDTTKTPGANPDLFTDGTGAEMMPENAAWDSSTKKAWAYIPLAVLTAYPDGLVRFWVHAKDEAGNWGAFASTDLVLDRKAPVLDTPPTPAAGATVGSCDPSCTIPVGAHDPLSGGVNSNIVSGEWFLDMNLTVLGGDAANGNDPGAGHGVPFDFAAPGTTVSDTFTITPALISQYLVMRNAATTTLPSGTSIKIAFRVMDKAGNWSTNTYVVGTA